MSADDKVLWYLQGDSGELVGPVPTDLVVRGIVAGRVPVSARVSVVGTSDWTPLVGVEEFAKAVREVVPPPPPEPEVSGHADPAGWYVDSGSPPILGPVTHASLLDGLRAGLVSGTWRVCAVGTKDWRRVDTVPQLAVAIVEKPSAPVLSDDVALPSSAAAPPAPSAPPSAAAPLPAQASPSRPPPPAPSVRPSPAGKRVTAEPAPSRPLPSPSIPTPPAPPIASAAPAPPLDESPAPPVAESDVGTDPLSEDMSELAAEPAGAAEEPPLWTPPPPPPPQATSGSHPVDEKTEPDFVPPVPSASTVVLYPKSGEGKPLVLDLKSSARDAPAAPGEAPRGPRTYGFTDLSAEFFLAGDTVTQIAQDATGAEDDAGSESDSDSEQGVEFNPVGFWEGIVLRARHEKKYWPLFALLALIVAAGLIGLLSALFRGGSDSSSDDACAGQSRFADGGACGGRSCAAQPVVLRAGVVDPSHPCSGT